MKTVLLDGDNIKTVSDIHKEFGKVISLPDYYGENLDALYDVLTDVKEELGVIVIKNKLLKNKLGKNWENFLLLMEDLNEEISNFYFLVAPFGNNQ